MHFALNHSRVMLLHYNGQDGLAWSTTHLCRVTSDPGHPNSQFEQEFFWELFLKECYPTADNSLWIGCNDIEEEGKWQHCPVKGETNAYANWAEDEPNNDYGEQDCGAIWFVENGKWDNQVCTFDDNYALCEIPVNSTPVSNPSLTDNNTALLTPRCLLYYTMEELLGNGKGAASCQSHPRCHSFTMPEQDGGKMVCPGSSKGQ